MFASWLPTSEAEISPVQLYGSGFWAGIISENTGRRPSIRWWVMEVAEMLSSLDAQASGISTSPWLAALFRQVSTPPYLWLLCDESTRFRWFIPLASSATRVLYFSYGMLLYSVCGHSWPFMGLWGS